LAIVLFVLFRFTASDYLFGIFKNSYYDRKHLLDKILWQIPNVLKFKHIMNHTENSKLKKNM
jgi:hypothetical protein